MKQLLKRILIQLFNWLNTLKWYQWCQKNSIYAHLIGGFILAQQVIPLALKYQFRIAIVISLIISSGLFFLKEYLDTIKPNPTGFDLEDIKVDYIGWVVGTWFGIMVYGIIKLISISL